MSASRSSLEYISKLEQVIMSQLEDHKQGINSLHQYAAEAKDAHQQCRESLLQELNNNELNFLERLVIIDKKVSALSVMCKIYFGLYTAGMMLMAEELVRHLSK